MHLRSFRRPRRTYEIQTLLWILFFGTNIILVSFAVSFRRNSLIVPLIYSFHFCNVKLLVWKSIKLCMLVLFSIYIRFRLVLVIYICLRDTILTLLDSLLFEARGVATCVSEGKRVIGSELDVVNVSLRNLFALALKLLKWRHLNLLLRAHEL